MGYYNQPAAKVEAHSRKCAGDFGPPSLSLSLNLLKKKKRQLGPSRRPAAAPMGH